MEGVGQRISDPLRAEHSKNKTARTIPLVGRLKEIIQGALADRDPDCPYVFHRDSRPIANFRKAWDHARKAAGLPNLLVRDLRRSGVRDLMRATGDQAVAMSISGHKTVSVSSRYNIVDESEAHGRKPPAPPSNPVVESYLRSKAMWKKQLKGGEA